MVPFCKLPCAGNKFSDCLPVVRITDRRTSGIHDRPRYHGQAADQNTHCAADCAIRTAGDHAFPHPIILHLAPKVRLHKVPIRVGHDKRLIFLPIFFCYKFDQDCFPPKAGRSSVRTSFFIILQEYYPTSPRFSQRNFIYLLNS